MYDSDASWILLATCVDWKAIMQQENASTRNEVLTVQEVATYLKVSRSTVWRWCKNGKLPAFRIGREWRIHQETLDKLTGRVPALNPQSE